FLDRHDLAPIDLADLDFGGHALDGFAGNLHAFGGDGINLHCAVVFDVDFAAGLLDDALDVLAARADQLTDSLRIDLHRHDAGSVFAQFRPGRGQGVGHFLQNGHARDPRLLDRFHHQPVGQARQFEVELKPGNAFFGARNLAVHVAESVLPADDVGEQLGTGNGPLLIRVRANADADAGHRPDQWHAGIHQREAAAANRSHRGGAVGLHDFASDANRIRKTLGGNHRLDGPFRQGAVADFPTTGAADATGFAHREIREVVVEDELFLALAAGVGIKFLRVFGRAERGQHERLGFAPAEQRRAVRPGEQADLANNLTNVVKPAAIHPFVAVQDQTPHRLLLQVIKRVL